MLVVPRLAWPSWRWMSQLMGSEASPYARLSGAAGSASRGRSRGASDDLLDGWWIGRVEHSLVAGRTPSVKAGERRRRAAPSGGVGTAELVIGFSFHRMTAGDAALPGPGVPRHEGA